MIDYEDNIYHAVVTALRAEFPNIVTDKEPSKEMVGFPRVIFGEETNSTAERYLTQDTAETFVDVMFEAQAYSNKQAGRRAEVKEIINTIDSKMRALGFVRIITMPLENLSDPTIARRVARWRGTISTDGVVYRR